MIRHVVVQRVRQPKVKNRPSAPQRQGLTPRKTLVGRICFRPLHAGARLGIHYDGSMNESPYRPTCPSPRYRPLRVVVCFALALALCVALCSCQDTSEKPAVETTTVSRSADTIPVHDIPGPAASGDYARLKTQVLTLIEQSGADAAVAFVDLARHQGFDINGTDQKPSASLIKLVILNELYDQAAQGHINLEDTHTLTAEDIVGGTGIIQAAEPGTVYDYGKLAELMINQSDNTAANILIQLLGMEAINAQAQELGLEQSKLERMMLDTTAQAHGQENYTSANDMATLLTSIYDGTFVNSEMSTLAKGALESQALDSALGSVLPPSAEVAHKTGTLPQVTNDAAIVYGAQSPYVLVILIEQTQETIAETLMGQISTAVYEFMSENE